MKDLLPLETERLYFRRFTEADLEEMHSYQSREDYAQHAWRGPRSWDHSYRVIAEHRGPRAFVGDGDSVRYAFSPKGGGELYGEIVLTLVDAESRQIEMGWVVNPEYTGQGIASEAASAAIRAAFERLDAHRVFARLDSLNTSSAKVCERLGMRQEALLKESHWQLDEWRDELIYGILSHELRDPGTAGS
ncbi:GNAT family N-acetyltransferase [Kocuria coralli]|uniref:GNAT family N-acetyltransferase n=1 Tax=Kocuria coralli TaxID=1461025 RepID=A0A5J5KW58_9MICC|nr:GNAT family N-acetyltransferase [Kocuria coralli]